MANIRSLDMLFLDDVFQMHGGYVLNFSDRTFALFFDEELNVDIDDPKYAQKGTSKGKRLKHFLQNSEVHLVARTLKALWEYREALRLRSSETEAIPDASSRFADLIRRVHPGAVASPPPAAPSPIPTSKEATGTIVLSHGSGAGDFQILGDPTARPNSTRTFFNARMLLAARGNVEAIRLMQAANFAVLPATNGFGDDFQVLHAEAPLHTYEEFRNSRNDYRMAARQLAEAFQEAGGPYIRFVSISLQLRDPEAWDVFICHASDDKATVARPLYEHLTSRGVHCWIDEAEIGWGESILAKVQEGLRLARYVIVILSSIALQKKWAPRELQAAMTLEIDSGKNVVLPLIVGNPDELLATLPLVRDKRYLRWSGDSSEVEKELRKLVRLHT